MLRKRGATGIFRAIPMVSWGMASTARRGKPDAGSSFRGLAATKCCLLDPIAWLTSLQHGAFGELLRALREYAASGSHPEAVHSLLRLVCFRSFPRGFRAWREVSSGASGRIQGPKDRALLSPAGLKDCRLHEEAGFKCRCDDTVIAAA